MCDEKIVTWTTLNENINNIYEVSYWLSMIFKLNIIWIITRYGQPTTKHHINQTVIVNSAVGQCVTIEGRPI